MEGHQVVVVVSAMGKSTDQLIALARQITDTPPAREMDMLLSTDGIPYISEINTIPGLSKESIIPRQAQVAGLSMQEMLNILLEDLFTQR